MKINGVSIPLASSLWSLDQHRYCTAAKYIKLPLQSQGNFQAAKILRSVNKNLHTIEATRIERQAYTLEKISGTRFVNYSITSKKLSRPRRFLPALLVCRLAVCVTFLSLQKIMRLDLPFVKGGAEAVAGSNQDWGDHLAIVWKQKIFGKFPLLRFYLRLIGSN
jgi:hypothetical protein